MAEFKLEADETDVIKALDNIEKKLAEVGQTADATGKKMEGSLDGVTKATLSAGNAWTRYQESVAANPNATEAQRKFAGLIDQQTKSIQVLSAETDAAAKKVVAQAQLQARSLDNLQGKYDSLKKTAFTLGEASRKSLDPATVAKYKEQIQVLEQEMATLAAQGQKAGGSITTGLEKATIAQRVFNFVMSLNPIGIIIAAIVLLVNQLRKYQGVIDTASKITSQIGAVFTVVTERAISLGKAIYSLVTLDFAGFGKNAAEGINGFGDAVSNAWTQAGNLADATVALRDAQLAAALSTAKLQAASDRALQASQDETKNFNQRIELLKKAIGLEAEIARIKVGFAEQDAALARQQFALSNGNVAAKEALLEKELALQETRNAADKSRIQILSELNKLEKERAAFIEKTIDGAQKLSAKIDVIIETDSSKKEVLKINQETTDLVNAIQNQIDKINEVQKLRPLDDKELALRQKLQDNIVDIIDDGQRRIEAAILEGIKRQNALEDKIREEKEKADKLKGEEARAALKDILDLELQKIAITKAASDNFIAQLKADGAKEEEIKKAQFFFNNNINGLTLQANLDFERAMLAIAGDGAEADIIKARIRELETLLQGIDIPAPKGKDGKPKTIFDLLGIKFDDPEQQQAFEQAVGRIVDSLGQLTEAAVQEAEAKTQAAQDKVDAAQEALDKELEIAEKGQANFSDIRRKELDDAKKARDLALKEEAKAKRQQIALDSAVQLSSLVTTAANIFKGFSTIPILGQVLAVISVAAMFASFAAAKSKALKAAEPPKLRKGAKIIGRTHEQGGELRELEDKEQVVGAAESAGQDVFFDRLRKGKYKGLDLAAIAEGRGDYQSPISESAARTTALQARRDKATETMHYNAITKAYERGADKIVDAINRKPSYAPWNKGYKKIKETGHGTDTEIYQPGE